VDAPPIYRAGMDFQDVVDRRRMVRNYDPDLPVGPATLERILANATHAPSAGFSQGWGFLVLREPSDRSRFWRVTAGEGEPDTWLDGLRKAPVLVVCCSDRDAYLDRYAEPDKGWTDRDVARWPVPYWDIDTGMAVLLMLQTVVDEGLGACFFGLPPERIPDVRSEFAIPAGVTPIGVVSVGHRAPDRPGSPGRRTRRSWRDVSHEGDWGKSVH
jgi:nitroreductase